MLILDQTGLGLVHAVLSKVQLYGLGVEQIIPLFKAILLAVIVAACFGALFGERIVHRKNPYGKPVFWNAVFMVLLALPVYTLGFVFFMKETHPTLFEHATLTALLSLYLIALLYIFTIAGIWFALLAGLAAIFLRGYIVNLLLHSLYKNRQPPPSDIIDSETTEYNLEASPPKNVGKWYNLQNINFF